MAQVISDQRDVEFVIYEQMDIEDLAKKNRFSDFGRETFDMVLSEARKLAEKDLLPTAALGDKEGCKFENGKVKVPDCYHRAYNLLREGGWIAIADDPEVGGQGLPLLLAYAAWELFAGANATLFVYAILCHGAGKLIEVFGTEQQKELFLKKLYTGEWAGTMVLTEPGAGSDVGALRTKAVKNSDGTYSITGNKIFISNAEQDLTENIINPVLARIEGAPEGTEGISLFIVPKIWVNEDGTLGEPNDIVCTNIEEKMGFHGSPTCTLALGENGQCRGLLLGEENKGMRTMFHMMNEERLNVGIQSLGHASCAYSYALNYAKERLQGKDLMKMRDQDAHQVPIIQHPDIRRMLLWMKAHVEGLRSLNYYVALCMDKKNTEEDEKEKERLENFIALLTPICKAYTSDRAYEVCVQAMQIYGGYGYCREYPVEQIARDCKITSIYEGTNGIQAMDLLGRKLGMKKGQVFMGLLQEIQKTVEQAKKIPSLENLAGSVQEAANRLGEIAMHMGQTAMSERVLVAFAHAYPFLEVMGDVLLSWMLLWRAMVAAPKLEQLCGGLDEKERKQRIQESRDAAFYDGQIKTAQFYVKSVLPATLGKMEAIKNNDASPVEIAEVSFGW